MRHMSQKCLREGKLSKSLGIQKFKGRFVWGYSTSKNRLLPESSRPGSPGQEVDLPAVSSCAVLITVCLAMRLRVSESSALVGKHYMFCR